MVKETRLLRVRDVAARLGLRESTIRRWIFTRRLPSVRCGKAVTVPESAIDRLIKENYRPAVASERRGCSGSVIKRVEERSVNLSADVALTPQDRALILEALGLPPDPSPLTTE